MTLRDRHRARAAPVLVLVGALLTGPSVAAAQEPSDDAGVREAFLSFRYEGLVNTVVTALYADTAVYLPVGELFELLHIDRSLDLEARRVSGFFLRPANSYELDFDSAIARIGGRESVLEDGDFLLGELDAYVRPDVLERVFGIRASVDFRRLRLTVVAEDTLPVLASARRARRRERRAGPGFLRRPAPLLHPRRRHGLNGGVLDYDVSVVSARSRTRLAYRLGAGLEVLGGDVEGRWVGSIGDAGDPLTDAGLRWRYVFGPDVAPWSTHIDVGSMTSAGILPRGFVGIRLTNEPIRFRTVLGEQVVTGTTTPNWEVELYLNEELHAHTRADANGRYRFSIPLSYGAPLVSLRFYGPAGQVESEDRRFLVPHRFVPPGRVEYRVSAGRDDLARAALVQGDVAYGIAGRLTGRLGIDYIDTLTPGAVPFAAASARLAASHVATVTAAADAFYRVAVTAVYPSHASLDLRYTRYGAASPYNPAGSAREVRLVSFVPLRAGRVPLNLRLDAEYVEPDRAGRRWRAEGEAALGLGRARPFVGYERVTASTGLDRPFVDDRLAAGLYYFLWTDRGALRRLNGGLVRTRVDYDLGRRRFDGLDLDYTQNVSSSGRLSLGIRHDPPLDQTRFEIGYLLDLPSARATADVRYQDGRPVAVQSARGAIGFDPRVGRVDFSNRNWVGRAGAAFRIFLDRNGNDAFDAGERVIEGAAVRFRESVAAREARSGLLRTNDLLAYHRYTVEVDRSGVRNPLWFPKQGEFSFIAEPNAYTPIDVPFYIAGEISGRVVQQTAGGERGVRGLEVHIRAVGDTTHLELSTFADGSFYHLGLPSGSYEAFVDPEQLEILDADVVPELRTFTIDGAGDGDIVDGIDFVLRRRTETT